MVNRLDRASINRGMAALDRYASEPSPTGQQDEPHPLVRENAPVQPYPLAAIMAACPLIGSAIAVILWP